MLQSKPVRRSCSLLRHALSVGLFKKVSPHGETKQNTKRNGKKKTGKERARKAAHKSDAS